MASFSVVTNIASVNAQVNLDVTNIRLRQTLTRVSSGLRINSSGDDAAGLAIANAFRSDVAILNRRGHKARRFLEPVLDEDFGIWSSKAVETIQRDVKTQTHAYQSRPRVSKSCHIDDDWHNRMQRMKAETTALGVEHWVGQEVVDVDDHGGEHHEPASLPMSSVSPECHRERNHDVKREVSDGHCCEHLGQGAR